MDFPFSLIIYGKILFDKLFLIEIKRSEVMRVFEFEAINSTNIFLKELENKKNYDLVISETQILGKGRRGNNWDSKRGGAYFSFILKEDKNISTDEYLKLPLVIGYSLLRTFEKIEPNLDFMFKWTNDIFINNRKLSGILVEKVEDNFIIDRKSVV